MFLVHRSHIVQPVKVGQVLQIRTAFHQLFGTTMQQANMWITSLDNFTIELQHKP